MPFAWLLTGFSQNMMKLSSLKLVHFSVRIPSPERKRFPKLKTIWRKKQPLCRKTWETGKKLQLEFNQIAQGTRSYQPKCQNNQQNKQKNKQKILTSVEGMKLWSPDTDQNSAEIMRKQKPEQKLSENEQLETLFQKPKSICRTIKQKLLQPPQQFCSNLIPKLFSHPQQRTSIYTDLKDVPQQPPISMPKMTQGKHLINQEIDCNQHMTPPAFAEYDTCKKIQNSEN